MRPHDATSNLAFYSRRHPRRLANSPLKKARLCLQHLPDVYMSSRCEFCLCPVMCLDFGLSLEQPAPVRENAGVVPLAFGLCHQQKPMPECAVPMIALLMSKRSPHLLVCQRYTFSFSTAVGPRSQNQCRTSEHSQHKELRRLRVCPNFLRSPHLGKDLIFMHCHGDQHDNIVCHLPSDVFSLLTLWRSCRMFSSMWPHRAK